MRFGIGRGGVGTQRRVELSRERGFTLIELLVAGAIAVVVLFATFDVVRGLAASSRTLAQRHSNGAALESLVDRWETESRTAEAITIPVATCPEIEFYTRDPGVTTPPSVHFWSYRFDATAKTITRYASDSGPLAPCAAANGDVVATNISGFSAGIVTATQLATHVDPVSGKADSPFVQSSGASDAVIPLGVDEADATTPIAGGNRIVEVTIDGMVASRVVDLLPGIAPSGFTVTLQYTCNARCDPHVPHDGARIDQCTGSYILNSAPVPTHYTFVKPSDPDPKPLWPPGTPASEPFYYPDHWGVWGVIDFHYFGGDSEHRYDGFSIVVPGDPANPTGGYYPAFIAPRDANTSADELIAKYGALDPSTMADNLACDALASPVPVYQNE